MIKEISFSKKAVERIDQLIAKKPPGTFFRIAVKGGGCSGFKYDFTFDNSWVILSTAVLLKFISLIILT